MKSKFNKPDTVYPHGSLREQPEMKKPVMEFELSDVEGNRQQAKDWQVYEAQLKKCRVIPCSENNWKDGQELIWGKDYYLKDEVWGIEPVTVAVPIVAQETEDRAKVMEVFDILNNWRNDNNRETIPAKAFLEISKKIVEVIHHTKT